MTGATGRKRKRSLFGNPKKTRGQLFLKMVKSGGGGGQTPISRQKNREEKRYGLYKISSSIVGGDRKAEGGPQGAPVAR